MPGELFVFVLKNTLRENHGAEISAAMLTRQSHSKTERAVGCRADSAVKRTCCVDVKTSVQIPHLKKS